MLLETSKSMLKSIHFRKTKKKVLMRSIAKDTFNNYFEKQILICKAILLKISPYICMYNGGQIYRAQKTNEIFISFERKIFCFLSFFLGQKRKYVKVNTVTRGNGGCH
jgi:hypothetical protein